MENDSKWFAHADLSQIPTGRPCRVSGSVLLQDLSAMVTLNGKRYPKTFKNNDQKKEHRSFSFSIHDNRAALHDSIETYDNAVGRKKFLDERRQHNSHFTFWDCDNNSRADERRIALPTYSSDYQAPQKRESTNNRRFPRNHLERSSAMFAQTETNFMWFGRHDSKQRIPLSVLGATNCHMGTDFPQYSHHNKH